MNVFRQVRMSAAHFGFEVADIETLAISFGVAKVLNEGYLGGPDGGVSV